MSDFPLTPQQLDIYTDQSIHEGRPLYNIGCYLDIDGPLDHPALQEAIQLAFDRHDVLRVAFARHDATGLITQRVHGRFDYTLPLIDLSGQADAIAQARRLLRERFLEPFDLRVSPLCSFALIRTAETRHFFLARCHHLVVDGHGLHLLLRSIRETYNCLLTRHDPPAASPSYFEYVQKQQAYLDSERFKADRRYWQQRFPQIPPALFPPKSPAGTEMQQATQHPVIWTIGRAHYNAMKRLAMDMGLSQAHFLLALLGLACFRTLEQTSICIGVPVHNRIGAQDKSTLGMFASMLPLVVDCDLDQPFATLMAAIAADLRSDYRHQNFPVSEIHRDLNLASSGRARIYDLMFSLEPFDADGVLHGASYTATPLHNGLAKTPLMIYVRDYHQEADVHVELNFNPDALDRSDAEHIRDRLALLFTQALQRPDLPLEAFSLFMAGEQDRILDDFGRGPVLLPNPALIHERFAAHAIRQPEALAVVYEDQRLTFGELARRVTALAQALRTLGVGPGVLVGLHVSRGPDMIAGLLGILAAGGAFVPLDPAQPAGRLSAILDDARPPVVLSDFAPSMTHLVAKGTRIVGFDALGATDAPYPDAAPSTPAPAPHDLAYLLYTSGSTGTPKGVLIEHRSVSNLLQALEHAVYRHHPDVKRVGVNASLGFDASIKQIIQIAAGRTLVLLPQSVRFDPAQLSGYLTQHRVDVLDITPQQMKAVIASGELRPPPGWPLVTLVGGEAIDTALWAKLCEQREHAFYNVYGPTECTVDATAARIDSASPQPHIGRPLLNVQVRILDPKGRIVPIGAVGELHIGGLGVARGYLHQTQLTTECFIPDPFGRHAGEWLYKTGDLARWLDDGRIAFIGRNDHQVKIRGFRIELGEIESQLALHPNIRQALVTTAGDTQSDKRLVAYFTVHEGSQVPDTAACREHLSKALPDYMVPSQYIHLDAFALTANGKLDRKALPAPDLATLAPGESVAPNTPIEQALWAIWSEVLGLKAFGTRESFFDLGGHSLQITQVASRIRERLGLELALTKLFEHVRIADLAQHLEALQSRNAPASTNLVEIPLIPRNGLLPMSYSQRRMWLIQQFDPASAAYNIPVTLLLRGPLDTQCLQRALDSLVQRHEMLRASLLMGEREPMTRIEPDLRVTIEHVDLIHLPADQRQPAARRWLSAGLDLPFNLSSAPLHRIALLRLDTNQHVLSWVFHHAIADTWALTIVMRELFGAYAALTHGKQPDFPPLGVQYVDYAAWQRSAPAIASRHPQTAYWLEQLRNLEPLSLPADHAPPMVPSFRGHKVFTALTPNIRAQVKQRGAAWGVTPFMLYLAAFNLLLCRISGATDIAIGSPIANRHHLATESLVGTLVNTLVMRTDLSGDPSFRSLVERVRATALGAYAHQDMPYDELVEKLANDRAGHPIGLVRVLFNLRNAPLGRFAAVDFDYEEFDFDRIAAQFDLSIHVDTEFTHRIHLEYSTDLYTRATAERLLDSYMHVLDQALARPDLSLSAFSLATPRHMDLLRGAWNATQVPLPPQLLVHRHVQSGLLAAPQREAVFTADARPIHFAELHAQALGFARLLRQRGIGRGQRVGLSLPRGAHMLPALLGVLHAGACYVPLDPAYPPQRLRDMAEDAELALILTHHPLQTLFAGCDVPMLTLDAPGFWASLDGLPLPPDAPSDARPDDPAYMIYTSGSTGRPKGVLVPHRAVVNFLASMAQAPGLGRSDKLLAVTTLSFDIAVLELLLPLAVGAQVVIADADTARDPYALRALLERSGCNVMQATPSTWRLLLDAGWNAPPGFRALVGGEALPPDLAERLLGCCGEVWNLYGPTETTVWSTAWKVENPRAGICIGHPIANTQVWVLDAHGHCCPIGVPGEIHIGGAGVALGYWRRPELTAERFIADALSKGSEARLYKTGDLGRWRHDGQLEHLGRLDHQVKLRGFRIELGDIEAALLALPQVADAVVSTHAPGAEDVRLVAYVVSAAGQALQVSALREALRERLPDYMLPQHIVALPALPRLPNGKINRGALPPPTHDSSQARHRPRAQAAPNSPAENAIAAVWTELLGTEQIAVTDNFFDLGGHSLLAMRAITTLEQRHGVRIQPRRMVLETLGQLANGMELKR
uniref:Putative AMP-dependent synthetase / ligase n=1 Tax=mine drainage metagenome TaxID=410659 RepID=E6PT23_9ZZZZ